MAFRAPRLLGALLLTVATFFSVPVGLGHGLGPAILFCFAWRGVSLAAWAGLFLLGFGVGQHPARGGATLVGLGVMALACAVILLVGISEMPWVTILGALPFAAAATWLVAEAHRKPA